MNPTLKLIEDIAIIYGHRVNYWKLVELIETSPLDTKYTGPIYHHSEFNTNEQT